MLFNVLAVVCVASVVVIIKTSTAQQQKNGPNPLEWAWKTYTSLFTAPGNNVIMSPHSVRNALGMLLLSSSGNTADILKMLLETESYYQTTDDFHKALRNDNDLVTSTASAKVANGVFANDRLQIANGYSQTLDFFYGGSVQTVPFMTQPEMARYFINDFIAQSTDGHLVEFLPNLLDRDTAIMLVSAIYFKADWTVPFAAVKTHPGTFHASAYDVSVDFMYRPTSPTLYTNQLYFGMFELPYADRVFSMYVILPWADVTLSMLEHYYLNAAIIDASIAEMAPFSLTVSLPKFSLTNKISLQAMISNMGASQLFDGSNDGRSYDFAHMFDQQITQPDVKLSDILHGAKIDVNEQGTVASAVTAVELGLRSMPENYIRVDRPFLFFIRHKPTGGILFWGRMEDPSLDG